MEETGFTKGLWKLTLHKRRGGRIPFEFVDSAYLACIDVFQYKELPVVIGCKADRFYFAARDFL